MAEGDFAGPGHGPAADQAGVRDGVVGGAKRAGCDEPGARREEGCDAVDARDLERFLGSHRREDRGHGAREERLSAAGRAAHDDVVAPGGGHFERALHVLLADDVGEVRAAIEVRRRFPGRARMGFDGNRAEEVRREAREGGHRIDLDAGDEGCLDCVRGGDECTLLPVLAREGDHRQDAVHTA